MIIDRLKLLKALEAVKPGLANKEIIEQTNSFAFLKNKVVTYNDEISISHPIKNLNIEGVVKADELYKSLIKMKSDNINLKKQKNEIIVKSGTTKIGLILQKEIKLSLENIKIKKWTKLPTDFLDGLKFCRLSCDKNSSVSLLSCVHLSKKGSLQASNGYKVASFKLSEKVLNESILIPVSTINEVIKYDITKISVNKNWVHFKTRDKTIISSRIYSDSYPDIEKILNFKGTKLYLAENLSELIDKAKIFSKSDLQREDLITIEIKDNKINVSAKTEIGWIKDSLKIDRKNKKNISFQINPEYILMILTQLNSDSCIHSKNKIKFGSKNWELVIPISISN